MKRALCPRRIACCSRFLAIMVLPKPLGPTITMLAACSRKLKVNSSSSSARSSSFGQP